ncbi:MAG TPA: tetratricopeptide repeat protein [Thermoanaerobaculia bacterium]|jgi:predicted Zn-dependent protease
MMKRSVTLFVTMMTAASLLAHDGVHDQIATVTARIKEQPKNAALYLQRGELHRLHESWAEARRDFDRAAKLDPALELVDFARGRMELEAGRTALAKKSLDKYIALHPEHAEARLIRARALVKLKRTAEAIGDYDAAVKHMAKPSPDLYHERAKVLAGMGPENVLVALRGLDEGMQVLGVLASLQQQAIELEVGAGRIDEALARLDTLAAQSQRKELYLTERGEILMKAGRTAEAQAAFREALDRIAALPAPQQSSRMTRQLVERLNAALATEPPPHTH